MKIENNILAISKAMFQDRENWKYVTKEQKEEFFFIYNRYLSKNFPQKAQLLNDKLVDKVSSMDAWYYFMIDKPYPKWFWNIKEIKKSEKTKDKNQLNEKDISRLMLYLDLKDDDIKILIQYYPDQIKEELKYLNDTEKGNK